MKVKKPTKQDIEYVNSCNNILKVYDESGLSSAEVQSFLSGICWAVEVYLHSRNIYKGFSYLNELEVPHGSKPGINSGDLEFEGAFENTNPYRRKYHI